ncbi:MAG: hypothetical protein VYA53_03435 [Acidobacteriota bacterium]|nr:hypothetical protein [Acidobacteriota bacterium]
MLQRTDVLIVVVCVGFFLVVPTLAVFLQSDAELAESMPEGEGKAMVTSVCTTCHSLGTVLTNRGTGEEWEQTVNEMITRGAQIFPDEIETMVDYLGTHYGPRQASSAAPSTSSVASSDGQQVFQNKCFQCHGDTMWRDLRQDRRSWEATLYRMVGRGALWTEEEIGQMADYLVSSYGPQ